MEAVRTASLSWVREGVVAGESAMDSMTWSWPLYTPVHSPFAKSHVRMVWRKREKLVDERGRGMWRRGCGADALPGRRTP